MRIGKIDRVSATETGVSAGEPASPVETSRALVPVAPPAAPRGTVAGHRQAPFLTQLLAVKNLHPQTRGRRRVSPQEAIAAYRSVAALTR